MSMPDNRISLTPDQSLKNANEAMNACETNAVDHIRMSISKERMNTYLISDNNLGYDRACSLMHRSNDAIGGSRQLIKTSSTCNSKSLKGIYEQEGENIYRYDPTQHLDVEEIYRLRMSDWCYKICDFIKAGRHIVPIAFNYLDRFLAVEKYTCDSSFDYKVSSISCLFIALKVHNRKTIKPIALASLSQGEITVHDILAMECMILKTLSFRLCPPTTYSFISSLSALLPSRVKEDTGADFVQKSFFLAELATMDIRFSTISPSVTAFAIIMHILDTMDDGNFLSLDEKKAYTEKLEKTLNITSCDCYYTYGGKDCRSSNNIRQMLKILCSRCDHFNVNDGFDNEMPDLVDEDEKNEARDDMHQCQRSSMEHCIRAVC